jgi:type IV secretory pathway VirB6-like protein
MSPIGCVSPISEIMEPPILLHLTTGLLAWAFITLGACVAGLYWLPNTHIQFWRGFWFMNGIWGLIDGIIGWANLLTRTVDPDFLRQVLSINSGLDVGYIVAGIVLATSSQPLLKGFGWAVVVQGLFLLIFDLTFLAWT